MMIKLKESVLKKAPKNNFLLRALLVGVRTCCTIVFLVLLSYPAAAQQQRCPQIKPQVLAKISSDMIRWAGEGRFTGCRAGPAPDIDCHLSQTFVVNAGVSPIYLGTRWSVLEACFPELKSVKSINEQATARNAELEKNKRAAAETARQEQQEKDNDPKHIVTRTYYDYILIRKCFDQRYGYVSINISAAELERAKRAAKGIEEAVSKRAPGIDRDAAWKNANSDSGNWKTDTDKVELMRLEQYNSQMQVDLSDRNRCQNLLQALERRFERMVPEENSVKKDF